MNKILILKNAKIKVLDAIKQSSLDKQWFPKL